MRVYIAFLFFMCTVAFVSNQLEAHNIPKFGDMVVAGSLVSATIRKPNATTQELVNMTEEMCKLLQTRKLVY